MSISIQASKTRKNRKTRKTELNEKNRGKDSEESGTSYNYSFRTPIHFLIKRPVHNSDQNFFNGAN